MDFSSLRTFLHIVEMGSFAAAARSLDVQVSTLSRRVFALENELGITLFERQRTGVRLTPTGNIITIFARQILADLDVLAQVAQSGGIGKQGRARLGIHIPPIERQFTELLARWHHLHPSVELLLYELSDGELCKAVRDRSVDAALIAEHALAPDLVSEPIYNERLVAAVPNRSRLSQQLSLSWAELRKEPVLVQDWPHSHMTRAFYGELFGHGTQFLPHAASKQSVLTLVAAGFGITLATASQALIGFPGVTFVSINEDNAMINIVLAWLPQMEDPAIGRFIAFIRDEARSLRSR